MQHLKKHQDQHCQKPRLQIKVIFWKSETLLLMLNPCLRMQHLKRYQDHLTLSFTNPVHALMLKLFPWQAQAKRVKHSIAGIQQVQALATHDFVQEEEALQASASQQG